MLVERRIEHKANKKVEIERRSIALLKKLTR